MKAWKINWRCLSKVLWKSIIGVLKRRVVCLHNINFSFAKLANISLEQLCYSTATSLKYYGSMIWSRKRDRDSGGTSAAPSPNYYRPTSTKKYTPPRFWGNWSRCCPIFTIPSLLYSTANAGLAKNTLTSPCISSSISKRKECSSTEKQESFSLFSSWWVGTSFFLWSQKS
jgi:hypothetical protein